VLLLFLQKRTMSCQGVDNADTEKEKEVETEVSERIERTKTVHQQQKAKIAELTALMVSFS